MSDRLQFKNIKIKDGVEVFIQNTDVPVTNVHITLPIGNAHSHKQNKYMDAGYVHFLEHMCFSKSQANTNKSIYENLLADNGAKQNAWTDVWHTDYYLEAPSETILSVIPAFINHITEPIFEAKDIEIERGIVTNEREQRKYFPGDDKLSQYKLTEWMDVSYYSREQIFGTDSTLSSVTSDILSRVHTYYRKLPISIFVAGAVTDDLLSLLEKNTPSRLSEEKLIAVLQEPKWKRKNYHEFFCGDVDIPIYHIGYVGGYTSFFEAQTIAFVIELLTHYEFGTLQQWIRKDKGWTYGITPSLYHDNDRLIFDLDIPVTNKDVVKTIRHEIHNRIFDTISNKEKIEQTKRRLKLEQCFDYETVSSRIDRAISMFNMSKNIYTETDFSNWLDTINSEILEDVYKNYFQPPLLGELLTLPK